MPDKITQKKDINYNSFKNEYAITEEEVLKLCGRQTVNQININEISTLIGILQSLKDGDTSVDYLMKPIRGVKEEIATKKKEMKKKKPTKLL